MTIPIPFIPEHFDTERKYDGRILDTYRKPASGVGDPTPGHGGETGNDTDFTYTAYIVDSHDRYQFPLPVSPFRRVVSSDLADRPRIIAASPGDWCEIDFHNGAPRLKDVPEQYLVGDCVPPTTTPPGVISGPGPVLVAPPGTTTPITS